MPGAGNGLNILSQKWKQLFEHRDEEIFQKYPNKMQFEVMNNLVLAWLCHAMQTAEYHLFNHPSKLQFEVLIIN